jgi:hypothetical protein
MRKRTAMMRERLSPLRRVATLMARIYLFFIDQRTDLNQRANVTPHIFHFDAHSAPHS